MAGKEKVRILQRANECPEDKYLNKFVRGKVCAACVNNPEIWRDLGIELMGQEGATKLDEIKVNNNENVTKCCSAMFNLWRQREPKANWNQLMKALEEVELHTLADEIMKLLIPSTEQQHTDDQLQLKQHPEQVQKDQNMQELDRAAYLVKYSGDNKNPGVWSAQISKKQQSQKRQQQQVNRGSTNFWSNFNLKWQQCPRMPEKCCATSVTELDGKVYVAAIMSDRFASFMYDINKKQWSPLPILSRSYYVLVAVHSKKQLLAVGGSINGTGAMGDEIFLWDETYKQWVIQYPNMPTPRCSVTGICYHSAVIVAGGITCWRPWTLTRAVEVLHINDSSLSDSHWSKVEQLPHVIYGAIPLLCNESLYISSVVDYANPQDENTFILLTASVPILLQSNNTCSSSNSVWNKLPDVPYSSYSIICYQGRLITFTGFYLVKQPAKLLELAPQIHIYNPETISWDCAGYTSCGYVLGMSVCVGENKMLFIGGLTGTYNVYDSFNWIHANLQLELTPVTHETDSSKITH